MKVNCTFKNYKNSQYWADYISDQLGALTKNSGSREHAPEVVLEHHGELYSASCHFIDSYGNSFHVHKEGETMLEAAKEMVSVLKHQIVKKHGKVRDSKFAARREFKRQMPLAHSASESDADLEKAS